MMIRVPSQVSVYHPGYGGSLRGLGAEGDFGGETVTPVDVPPAPIDTGGGVGFDWSTFGTVLKDVASGAVGIIRATTPPSLIPGTNTVYDPATGRILGPGQSNITTPYVSGSISNTGLLVGGAVAIGLIVLIFAMKR
jgi:hypothetical protein